MKTVRSEELEVNKTRTCLDCLHCKVSAKSTVNRRLCFCAKEKKKARHREPFWLAKKLCEEFENMGSMI
jgi:hypothetical protein